MEAHQQVEPYLNPELIYQIEYFEGEVDKGLKGRFVAIQSTVDHVIKKRSSNTRWVYLQKLGEGFMQSSIKWKFIPQGHDNIYRIVVAAGEFLGHELFCHLDTNEDKRDNVPSYFVFAAPPGYLNRYNKWKVQKCANSIFVFKNTQNNYYLSSHSCFTDTTASYRSDIRDKNSSWMIGHPHERTCSFWKIKPF